MKKVTDSGSIHFLAAGIFSVVAIVSKKKKWRYSFLSFAVLEIAQGFRSQTTARQIIPFESAPVREKWIKVKDIKMRWEEHGDGSSEQLPIIMVHGLPTNPRVWRYVIPMVTAKGLKCLAWEQVGFGKSLQEGLGRNLSIFQQAEYLKNWLQTMGISRAIFVGHDYGGGVIQQLMLKHPGFVAGVVLTDVVAFRNWPVITVRLARTLRKQIKHFPSNLIKPILWAGITNLGHQNTTIKKDSFKLFWEPYNNPTGPKALSNQLSHFWSENTARTGDSLEKTEFNFPSRVIWGEEDPLGVSSGKRLAKAINSPMTIISGGKHFTLEDHPQVISDAIIQVFSEVELLELKNER